MSEARSRLGEVASQSSQRFSTCRLGRHAARDQLRSPCVEMKAELRIHVFAGDVGLVKCEPEQATHAGTNPAAVERGWHGRRYSALSVTVGSTRVARRAGIQLATVAATPSTATIPTYVTGSAR